MASDESKLIIINKTVVSMMGEKQIEKWLDVQYVQKEIIYRLYGLLIKLMENGIIQNNFSNLYWLLLAIEESADMETSMHDIEENYLRFRKDDFISDYLLNNLDTNTLNAIGKVISNINGLLKMNVVSRLFTFIVKRNNSELTKQ